MNGNIMHSILTNQERRIFELIINNKSTEEERTVNKSEIDRIGLRYSV